MGTTGGLDQFVTERMDSLAQSAEMGVIGALVGNTEAAALCDMLEPEMFTKQSLRSIFEACKAIREDGKQPDVVTILGKLGGEYKADIAACADFSPSWTLARAEGYAQIVRENWRKRVLYGALAEAQAMTLENGVLVKEILPTLEAAIEFQARVEQAVTDGSAKSMTACLTEFLCLLSKKPDGIKTGFQNLDYLTGGFQRKGVYVISARPGAGKTDFGLHLAVNMSKSVRVNYNTLEMPATQCIERIVSRIAGINSAFIRDRNLSEDDYAGIARISDMLCKIPLIIDDATSITAAEVKGKILKHRPDVIFLDNLQLIGATNKKKNQWEEIADTTRMLKKIALDHNVVIVLLVQESREGGKGSPSLSGLRGSSSVESDADAVIFIRNEATEKVLQGDDFINTDTHIVKNRHGGTGVCKFHWQPQYHKYIAVEVDR